MSTAILLVGAGKMGTALARGWVKAGLGPITAVDPKPTAALQALGLTVVSSLAAVPPQDFAACVIALKPNIVRRETAKLKAIAATTPIISIAAGTTIAFLQQEWGKARIVRVMPNLPGSIGRGVSALYAAPAATAADSALAEKLLSAIGHTVWLDNESQIDAVTGLSGSGPAYIFVLVDALAKAGVAAGLPQATAMELARATITGSAALLDADPRSTAQLTRDVATPGGTTEAALKVLAEGHALDDLMIRTVAAAKARAEEMAKG
jgi:pyrroline-5-carboxylate reductase